MSEERAELISALLDGELEGEQREQALDAVLAEPALRRRWHAYHLIGDVLRAQAAGREDFADRVRAAIDREPGLEAPRPQPAARPGRIAWLQPVGGLALAAGLATAAVLGGRHYELQPPADTVVTAVVVPAGSATPSATGSEQGGPAAAERTLQFVAAQAPDRATATRMRWTTADPAVQQRLNAYLVNYSEYLGTDLRGMLPYARVVGYDGRSR